jgi:hypothetical protein
VKNPVAKAALEKNIKKSYAKLAKKQAKFEDKSRRITSDEDKIEDQEVVDHQDVVEVKKEASTTPKEAEVETDTPVTDVLTTINEDMVTAPVQIVDSSTIKTKQKESPVEDNQQKEQVKEETKQEKETIKQEIKKDHVEVKEEMKQQKNEAKQNAKQQHGSSNGNAQEKVKKENEK